MAYTPPTPGGRYDLPPEEIKRKLDRYERLGHRCDGGNRTCFRNAATWWMRLSRLDRDTQEWTEPYTVQVCARHRAMWTRNDRYKIIKETRLLDGCEKRITVDENGDPVT